MKKLLFTVCAVFVFVLAFSQDKPEGLFINSKAKDFSGKDQNGNEVSLKDLRKKGYVVVMFYRGSWCPYCNRHLQKFQDSLALLTEKGATVVAITPETAEGISKTAEKIKPSFPLIHDEEMKIAKAYGVSYKVDDRTVQRYKNTDIDLLKINDQREASLPVPAVYVINKDGSVTYRFFDSNYKKRPSVREILDQIK
jgi:peroxiredoxin